MRLLIVDDDAVFCSLAKAKLSPLGANTSRALDGLAGLQLALEEEFDLAFIDLGLPGLDGISLIERLRHHPKTQRLPIIVITGRDDREAIEGAFAAGAALFLTKPINWLLVGYQINCVTRLTRSERDAHESHQQARAQGRIKDNVIGRLNNGFRPMARELAASAREIATLARSSAAADTLIYQAELIEAGARRLDAGLANMTMFADAARTEPEMQTSLNPVSAVVDGIARNAMSQAAARKVIFRTDLPTESIRIKCDGEQLSRALGNLLDNAIRFAPIGSVVALSAKLLDDGSLYFSIDDEGCGIAPDKLVQILAPQFGRGEDYAGLELTGMGLAVAKRIAEMHGGSLTVRTAVARGTTAIIHLPSDRVRTRSLEAA